MKRATGSNLAADDMMNLVIFPRVRIGPLLAGMDMSLDIKM